MLRALLDWIHHHRTAVDVAVVALLSPLALLQIMTTQAYGWPLFGLVGFLWGAAYVAPLLLRRRAPSQMGLLLLIPHAIQLVALRVPDPGNFVLPLAFYSFGAHCSSNRARTWLYAGLGASVLAGARWSMLETGRGWGAPLFAFTISAISCAAIVSASWFAGSLAKASRENVEALRERNQALVGEKDQSAKLAVAEERARIAREMHDVVAHSLSLIVVQTDGAAYVAGMDGDPHAQLDTARQALETIGTTARQALADTRRLVGVLNDEGAALAPQATLAQIPALVESVQRAGFGCTLDIRGDYTLHPLLDQSAQMAAYRIVQESLTNVMKHAGQGASASVILADVTAGLDILVSDDGRGPVEPDGLGHGLIGMRERATSVGGSFDAHPNPHGGFTVHAIIPPGQENSR